jgi:CDP-glycerol glycerophosphotransferase (TagB/SpsB family)
MNKFLKISSLMIFDSLNRFMFFASVGKSIVILSIILAIKPILSFFIKNNEEIWLIGENSGDILNDNSYCFFKFCHKNEILNKDIYFLARKKCIQRDIFLQKNKNVIEYSSFKHLIYLVFSKVFIYSQTHRDIIFDPIFQIISKGKIIISLKHGVFGLKKAIAYFHKHCNEPDLITVVSEFEKKILSNHTKTDEKKLKITGLARFDFIKRNKRDSKKQIVFIPTWRDWIEPNNFFKSKFYVHISEVINNQLLIALLKQNNISFEIYLHKLMKKYVDVFENRNKEIRFVKFGEKSIQELLNESNMLITDYSSVSWDFYYADKPVIFYQFDLEEYLHHRGSYISLKTDLFGDRAYSIDTLIDLIRFYINNNFSEKEHFCRKKKQYFKYVDNLNCQRIYREIEKILSAQENP